MSVFSKLDPDIITFHILPHLDGKTLIILSSVSSQFHNLIWKNINNNYLWRNICTSKWPSLLTTKSEFHSVISMFPCGYRSFFCDAFPSIHPPLNNPPPLLLPPNVFFFYVVDIFLHGEQQPLYSLHVPQLIDTSKYFFQIELYRSYAEFNFINVKKEGCLEYLKQKLTFSCVVIEPIGLKHAGSLFNFGCKAVSAKPVKLGVKVLFETVIPVPVVVGLPISHTEMMKCRIKVECFWEGEGEDKFRVRFVNFTMKDMNGKRPSDRYGAAVILNAIQNGERRGRNI